MIITLKNGNLTAQVDSFGAQLISIKDLDGVEYIWQRKSPYWNQCAPILFPIVGRAVDGTITIDEKDYPMSCHGFASGSEFKVVSQTEDKAVFLLESNDNTREIYPFEFALTVTISLDFEGVKTEMKVLNTDNKDIVFGIGGHPGISWPIFEGDSYDDYIFEFDKEYELVSLACTEELYLDSENLYRLDTVGNTLPLSRNIFKYDTITVDDVPFNTLKFVNKKGAGVRFDFDNFNTFAVWSQQEPGEAPFLCLEPWTSMGKRTGDDTRLDSKKDIVTLGVNKEHICSYKISPVK